MKKIDDRLWSAYLDGELSVTEVENLEAGLTADELEHLRKEKVFDQKISERLNGEATCPDKLWNSLRHDIENDKKSPKKFIYLSAVAALAACISLFFIISGKDYGAKVPDTVAELEKLKETTSELDSVNMFLKEKKIDLQLLSLAEGHHNKRIIGAAVEDVAGEEVVTLMFECCGRPVKVYVLLRDSAAEHVIQQADAEWKGGVRAQAKKGNYRLALVSKHGAADILDAIVPGTA